MAHTLSKEELLVILKKQYADIGAQIASLEGKPAPIKLHSRTPNQIVDEARTSATAMEVVVQAEDLSKLSPIDRVLKKHPDLAGFKSEMEKSGLKTDAELLALAKKLDGEAVLKSAEKSAKAQPTAPVVSSTAAFRTEKPTAPAKPTTPLSPLEAALDRRPDLASFRKELEAESKKPGVTAAQLIALGNKLDEAKISGK